MGFSTKLPTMIALLDSNGKWQPRKTRGEFEKERKPYYVAVAHYEKGKDGEPQVYLEFSIIKKLVYMVPDLDPDYQSDISKEWRYGVRYRIGG